MKRREKRKRLEKLFEWEMLLGIVAAPHIQNGIRDMYGNLRSLRAELLRKEEVSEQEKQLQDVIVRLNQRKLAQQAEGG